jgi:hypothetical protein
LGISTLGISVIFYNCNILGDERWFEWNCVRGWFGDVGLNRWTLQKCLCVVEDAMAPFNLHIY